jgi:ABC-2 type transport system ATP-binding protein
MTVRDYLTFCARIKGVPSADRTSRVNTVMERTRIADMANRHCGKLSKGYRQRVGLAQAIVHNPEVLILDEPTAGLDPKQINETRKLIRELAGDHTIVLSTHILPEVSQTCQRVVIINKGRVVAVDSVENLTARAGRSASVFVHIDAGNADPLPLLRGLPGVTSVTASDTADRRGGFDVVAEDGRDVRRDLAAAVVNSGWGLLELRAVRRSLEDVFLNLTTEEPAEAVAEAANE